MSTQRAELEAPAPASVVLIGAVVITVGLCLLFIAAMGHIGELAAINAYLLTLNNGLIWLFGVRPFKYGVMGFAQFMYMQIPALFVIGVVTTRFG